MSAGCARITARAAGAISSGRRRRLRRQPRAQAPPRSAASRAMPGATRAWSATPTRATRSRARRTRRRRIRARRQRRHGCESCHGPGQAHVDDDAKGNIRKFAQIKPAEIERDLPDVPQPRQSRGMGRQRARAPQSLVQHVPQRAQPEVGRTAARQGDRDRSSAPRATGCR